MHTPRLFGLLLVLAQGFPLPGHADTGVPSSIRYDRAAAPNPIVISWPASPGDAYLLKAAPVLGSPWQALTPSPLLAITNGLLWRDTADQRSRFYQVFRLEGDLALQGQVTDALNGSPLAGVTVTAGGRTAVTDNQGAYTLANLSAGSLAVDFTADPLSGQAPLTVRFQNLSSATPAIVTVTGAKPGYFTYTNAQVTLLGGGPSRLDFSLSPIAVGKLRFVLNWGARPKDLDAHLVTPSIGGKSYEIYYAPNHHGDTNGPPYAQLDVDRTAGFGPETITINRFEPGTYRYFVHNYQDDQGNTGELRDSGAVVQVYSDLGLLRTINLPAGEEGSYWEVCAIDGATGKLTVVNALRALKPASVGGFPDGEPGVKAMSDGETRAARFLWDFGDQTSSEEENPVKVYAAAGVYDVSLRVWFADQRAASQLKPRFITVTAPPILITRQPEDQTVAVGTNVTLQVAATGPAPLGYQWRKAGLELSGATNATLVMNRVQTNDAGNYTVVVSGPFGGAVTSRVAVVTVRTLPLERAWTRIWGTPGDDYVGGMVADQAGSVYVVGATTGALDGQTNLGGADAFLTKYTTNGMKVWTRQWGDSSENSASVVAVDGAGDIYVAGSTLVSGDPTFGDWDAVLTKFAPDGRLLWSEQWGSNQHDFGYGLTVDSSNQVYVAGYTWSTFDGEPGWSGWDDAFLSKFTPDGKRLWSRIWRPGPENVASTVVADRAGNVYVAGFTKGPVPGQPYAGDFDYYLNKYSPDGVLQWTRTGGSSERDGAGGLGVDSLGRIYVCGWTYGALAGQTNAGDGDVFLAQYLPDGSPGWTRQLGSSGFDYLNAIKVDAADHIWVSGYSDGAFDGQTNSGGNDAFLTVFAPDGTQLWTRFLGSAAADIGVAVDVGVDGAIYQAGYTAGGFDGQTVVGGYDAFLTRWLPPALPAISVPGR